MQNEFILSNMTDFEFAKWIRKQDENWKFEGAHTVPPVTHFFARGVIVAYAIYDNAKCSRKLFIKQS